MRGGYAIEIWDFKSDLIAKWAIGNSGSEDGIAGLFPLPCVLTILVFLTQIS